MIRERGGSLSTLRRLAKPIPRTEQCALCSVGIAPAHRHLLEVANRKIICACDPCALRFQDVAGGRFKLIPRGARALPGFEVTEAEWERLALPINLAFFFHNTAAGKWTAMYPSPAGAMESLLPLESWNELVAENPVLAEIEPDVQALLVNRVGSDREYFIAPIDACYELVGLIRTHWRGLSGGEAVWRETRQFFVRLAQQSEPRRISPGAPHHVTAAESAWPQAQQRPSVEGLVSIPGDAAGASEAAAPEGSRAPLQRSGG